jgi:lysophospholipase L1-like esterase
MLFLSDNYNKISSKITPVSREINPAQNYDSKMAFDNCGENWLEYCSNILAAVEYAKNRDLRVFVISEPNRSKNVQSQKNAINKLIKEFNAKRGQDATWIDYTDFLNLESNQISFDKMHLTPAGNRILAERISQDLRSYFSE